jgi:polysaccharide export outer membrane protein
MTSRGINVLAALLILLAGIQVTIAGQERPRSYRDSQPQPVPAVPSTPVSPNVLFSSDEDYRIGATDVLQITVQDAPELSNTLRVNASGMIPMPFLGQLKAAGKTPEELEKQIANGLRGEYLTDPQVSVAVVQYNSRSLFIQGAVKNPGVYIIEGRPSLLKLITMAGGLAENHGSTAFVIREIRSDKLDSTRPVRSAAGPSASAGSGTVQPAVLDGARTATTDEDEGKYEMKQVNINSLLKGNFSQNLVIQPGDIINIPNSDVFFVAGEVRSPGSFPLKEGTTLRQAISLAQGVTFRAKPSLGIIFREDPKTARRQEIKVDIGDVMAGKKDDIPIQANDIIIVPNSRLKSVTQTLLSAFGTSATRIPIP